MSSPRGAISQGAPPRSDGERQAGFSLPDHFIVTTPCSESRSQLWKEFSQNSVNNLQCLWNSLVSGFGSFSHFFLKRFGWFIAEISWFKVCLFSIKPRFMPKKVVFFQSLQIPNVILYRKFYRFWWFLRFLVVFSMHLNREGTNFESRYLGDESTKSLQKKMRKRRKARDQAVPEAL